MFKVKLTNHTDINVNGKVMNVKFKKAIKIHLKTWRLIKNKLHITEKPRINLQ